MVSREPSRVRGAECCAGLDTPLSREDAGELSVLLKALSDPARLQILSIIRAQPGNEACVCHLIDPLGLSQPTVSHHLKVLHEAGLLERERRGTWIWYRLAASRLADVRRALS